MGKIIRDLAGTPELMVCKRLVHNVFVNQFDRKFTAVMGCVYVDDKDHPARIKVSFQTLVPTTAMVEALIRAFSVTSDDIICSFISGKPEEYRCIEVLNIDHHTEIYSSAKRLIDAIDLIEYYNV